MLPFTSEQFLAIFAGYNRAIWPVQTAAYLLAGLAVALLAFKDRERDRLISGILAATWFWTGLVYHGFWFSTINRGAYLFAVLFIIQGGYLLYAGAFQRRICFGLRRGIASWTGIAFVFYATIAYPLVGIAAGHRYPEMPMFGVTPCPVTIFTLGFLLLTVSPVPRPLFVIPVAWSLIGGSAAILLDVPQDWLLLVSGGLAVILNGVRDGRTTPDIRRA